jgi:hypothetical protein
MNAEYKIKKQNETLVGRGYWSDLYERVTGPDVAEYSPEYGNASLAQVDEAMKTSSTLADKRSNYVKLS